MVNLSLDEMIKYNELQETLDRYEYLSAPVKMKENYREELNLVIVKDMQIVARVNIHSDGYSINKKMLSESDYQILDDILKDYNHSKNNLQLERK